MRRVRAGILVLLLAFPTAAIAAPEQVPRAQVVRACVIGGMTMTDLWQTLSARFEQQTGYHVEVVATGPRYKISPAFRRGEADLLTMHSGDITTDLVADGYGINMRAWTRNDLIIAGPPADPAGIRGMKDGAAALKKIADAQAPFMIGLGMGPFEMGHKLWRRAGIRPRGEWVLKDSSVSQYRTLKYAEQQQAYLIFGRMPIVYKKAPWQTLEILVEDDPTMRRPYVVMEANPARFAQVNHKGARALADFLLSKPVQEFLLTYGVEKNDGRPWFYPVWPVGPALE